MLSIISTTSGVSVHYNFEWNEVKFSFNLHHASKMVICVTNACALSTLCTYIVQLHTVYMYMIRFSSREKIQGGRSWHVQNLLIWLSLTHVAKMDRFVVRRPCMAVEELASRIFFVMFSSDWSSKKNKTWGQLFRGEKLSCLGVGRELPPCSPLDDTLMIRLLELTIYT